MEPANWETKRALICHYNDLASAYDSLYRDEQCLKIKSALGAISFEDPDVVLDVGCGTGILFSRIGNTVKLLVGLDISSGLLKIAAERSKKLNKRSSVHLIRADADYLPFSKEIFRKVFAVTLLQNSPVPGATLREMMRVAETDSTIVVTALRKHFSEEEFRHVLRRAGLRFRIVNPSERAQDSIAVCRKAHNNKDK